jgi:putative transcriptional regulator
MIYENYKGKLLISSPEISDGIFDKSIILICEHDANGTMGFILNKPLIDVTLETIWTNLGYKKRNPYSTNKDVFIGGPLASNAMFVIHSPEYYINKKTIKVCEGISVTGTKEITDDIQNGRGPRKALFLLGYSGWTPGQLEDEIMRDSWFISEKFENLIFSVNYQSMWADALFLIGIDPSKLSSYAGSS